MSSCLGYSVYLSNFKEAMPRLIQLFEPNSYIFTSFHIKEEMDRSYAEQVKFMCHSLNKIGYKIIGDVSRKTLEQFKCQHLWEFAKMMELSILRIDYGFTDDEIIELGKRMPIAVNASTIDRESADKIVREVKSVYGMHNFYPRPETGLDQEFFEETNKRLGALGMKVMAFIPGDILLRGPLDKGLPTLESHRYAAPFAAYMDLRLSYGIDKICVGDGIVSQYDADRIKAFENEGILEIPVDFIKSYRTLYGKTFTIRADSPRWIKRLTESREYSCLGIEVLPGHIAARDAGSITIDNVRYLRYSGEIQIVIESLPKDDRVNVIGQVEKRYKLLLKNIRNGQKIKFVEIFTKN